jgi:hypothetical protein
VCCLKTCIIDANFEAQKVYDIENSNVESKHSTLLKKLLGSPGVVTFTLQTNKKKPTYK